MNKSNQTPFQMTGPQTAKLLRPNATVLVFVLILVVVVVVVDFFR